MPTRTPASSSSSASAPPTGGPDDPEHRRRRRLRPAQADLGAEGVARRALRARTARKPAVVYSSTQHAREWLSTRDQPPHDAPVRSTTTARPAPRSGTDGDPVAGVSAEELTQLVNSRELWFVPRRQPGRLRLHVRVTRTRACGARTCATTTPTASSRASTASTPTATSRRTGATTTRAPLGLQRRDLPRHRPRPPSPRRKALDGLFRRVNPEFNNNFHTFGQLLLYPFGWQVNTYAADDPLFRTLSGIGREPGHPGLQPGRRRRALHHQRRHQRPRLRGLRHPVVDAGAQGRRRRRGARSRRLHLPGRRGRRAGGVRGSGAVLAGHGAQRARPGAERIAPRQRRRRTSRSTPSTSPSATRRPCRSRPSARSARSTVNWQVGQGAEQTAPTTEWTGGERYGDVGDVYYHRIRAAGHRHRARRRGQGLVHRGRRARSRRPSPTRRVRLRTRRC